MLPIHKFNDGRGATLCNNCRKIIKRGFTEDLFCQDCDSECMPSYKYKLERTDDGLVKEGDSLIWIEWKEDGSFKRKHDETTIGSSLVLDYSGYRQHTWMTTTIKKIDSISENLITFQTENSSYKLYINY
jgi:hypothetical protein